MIYFLLGTAALLKNTINDILLELIPFYLIIALLNTGLLSFADGTWWF